MGKYKSVMLFLVAVVIALITSLLVYGYLQRKGGEPGAVVETEPVIVAAVDLSWGMQIRSEMVKKVDFLKGSLTGGYFSDPSLIVGRVLLHPVKANEPIFESRLAPMDIKTGGVAAVITLKKRAVAVKVDKVIGVSGFIHPGNRVDVLMTLATGRTSTPVTRIILENILVLAVGSELKERKGSEEKMPPTDVITLEVTPREAEKLALAATEGRLQLALRNFSDTEDVSTRGTTLSTLLGSHSYGLAKETKTIVMKEVEVKKEVPQISKAPPVETKVEEPKVREPKIEEPKIEEPKIEESKVEEKKVEVKLPPTFIVELIRGSKVTEVKFQGSAE